ncbi:hypothetical protein DL96DRAFT_1491686 [Flagelloscypha sp. PMI_526]|nr:hypothetical protein DL96DRAFT_1491686 [Flagelloscypha sp. PMI_526]
MARAFVILSLLELTLGSPVTLAATPTSPPLLAQRDLISTVVNGVTSVVSDVASIPDSVKSAFKGLQTEAASGVIPGFDIPSSDDIKKKSGLNDTQIDQLPVHILNIPGFANWTDNGWNLYIHGQAYKEVLTGDALDQAAEAFIPDDLKTKDLTPEEAAQARNLTSAIFSLPVENVQLDFTLSVDGKQASTFRFNPNTDSRGEFAQFVPLNKTSDALTTLQENVIQKIDVTLPFDTQLSNATSYLVPPSGLSIVSDIDDILRVTKIYQPEQGLNNTFVNKFIAWSTMPKIYSKWQDIKGVHFHYLTTTPEPATRMYEQFIFGTYPGGSFSTRPYNFTTFDQIFNVREVALRNVMQSFPQRKFVLVGDTTNKDVMKLYPSMAKEFNGSVTCILLRNTSNTDGEDKFPYDTSDFKGLDKSSYFFFNDAADLTGLDIENGQCVNKSIPQDVKFGWQNLPWDSNDSALSHPLRWTTSMLLFALMMFFML